MSLIFPRSMVVTIAQLPKSVFATHKSVSKTARSLAGQAIVLVPSLVALVLSPNLALS